MPTAIPTRLVTSLSAFSPKLRELLWQKLYSVLAARIQNPDWTFMNYGYLEGELQAVNGENWSERCAMQLYGKVISEVELQGKDLLEVGCGRGGGSAFVARTVQPKSMVGVDFSPAAIELCTKRYASQTLSFKVGNAEALPFADNSFDAVINVESSHCYPNPPQFYREVQRVLRPGGHFLWADLRGLPYEHSTIEEMRAAGLELVTLDDISPQVLRSMEASSAQKEAFIRKSVPLFLRSSLKDFAGVAGRRIYDDLSGGKSKYMRCVWRKPG